jgi:hypothetical protein
VKPGTEPSSLGGLAKFKRRHPKASCIVIGDPSLVKDLSGAREFEKIGIEKFLEEGLDQ